jgi:hypothetical protein
MQISRKDLYRIIMEEYIKEESETPADDFQLEDLKTMIRGTLTESPRQGENDDEYLRDVAGDGAKRGLVSDQLYKLLGAHLEVQEGLVEVVGDNLVPLFDEGAMERLGISDLVNGVLEKMDTIKNDLGVLVELMERPEDYY